MGIEKEREAFEAIFGKNGCEYYPEYNAYQNGNDRNEDAINGKWYAWQAAKKQAIPEGFVLVSKEPSIELVNHGHDVFLGHFNEGGQTGGRSLYFAYKAMIEAQEQSHD